MATTPFRSQVLGECWKEIADPLRVWSPFPRRKGGEGDRTTRFRRTLRFPFPLWEGVRFFGRGDPCTQYQKLKDRTAPPLCLCSPFPRRKGGEGDRTTQFRRNLRIPFPLGKGLGVRFFGVYSITSPSPPARPLRPRDAALPNTPAPRTARSDPRSAIRMGCPRYPRFALRPAARLRRPSSGTSS